MRHAVEDAGERSGGLARSNQRDVEIIEAGRRLPERGGERLTFTQVVAKPSAGAADRGILLIFRHDVERLLDLKPSFQQVRQFTGEEDDPGATEARGGFQ